MHVIRFNQYKVYLILVKSNIACSYCCINEKLNSLSFMHTKKERLPSLSLFVVKLQKVALSLRE